mgnify:CR=1 FL=1
MNTSIQFIADTVLGTFEEPLRINDLEWIESTFRAYPNPVTDFVQVTFNSKVKTTSELILYNLQMQKIFKSQFDVNEGENSIRIPMEGQARGSYILHLKVSNRTFSKVVIKR